MRTQILRRKSLAALCITAIVTAYAGAATADNIYNNLDATIDAVAEIMPLNAGGATGSTTLYVSATTGDDGATGCNFGSAHDPGHVTFSVSSDNTSVATVSPTSVTFDGPGCGDSNLLTVTPHDAGSATITLAQTASDMTGTFATAAATFTVNVAPAAPSNTAPTLSISGVEGGTSYDKGSVPTATCNVVDAEDGNSSFPATLSAITGPYASDGIGDQTASCAYTDGGGLDASASVTYSIIDPSAPDISYVLTPPSPDGNNDWYKSNVTLTWTVSEPDSPNSLVKTGCVDQSITADQSAITYSCSASSAGGSAGPVSVSIKRDATPPSISAAVSPAVGTAGWWNEITGAPTVTYTCSDGTSGIASCSSAHTFGEAADQSDTGSAEDQAGNPNTAGVSNINVDLTDPGITWAGPIGSDNPAYYWGSVPAVDTCTASDSLSGPQDCAVSGYLTSVGDHTLTATAHDNALNEATDTRSYSVKAWTLFGFYQPVDMSGILNIVKGGATVPLKFEVFAASELTSTSVVKSFVQTKIACDGTAPQDDIEVTTTGGTTLRYDTTAGQFIQNWQTPKLPGQCYRVTMTTQDGSSLSANFKLK